MIISKKVAKATFFCAHKTWYTVRRRYLKLKTRWRIQMIKKIMSICKMCNNEQCSLYLSDQCKCHSCRFENVCTNTEDNTDCTKETDCRFSPR